MKASLNVLSQQRPITKAKPKGKSQNSAISTQSAKTLKRVLILLQEIANLLDDFAPAWYDEKLYLRTRRAVKDLQKLTATSP